MDANIMQSCGKMLQVFELYVEQVFVFMRQIVRQLLQITHIGIEGIG